MSLTGSGAIGPGQSLLPTILRTQTAARSWISGRRKTELRALARTEGDGESPDNPITVSQALDRYRADLTTRGGDIGNVERIRIHLSATLLTKDVALLASRDLRKWRDDLVMKLAAATVNRTAGG